MFLELIIVLWLMACRMVLSQVPFRSRATLEEDRSHADTHGFNRCNGDNVVLSRGGWWLLLLLPVTEIIKSTNKVRHVCVAGPVQARGIVRHLRRQHER